MWMTVGERRFAITLTDNAAARAFAAQLPLTLDMGELNGNEKHADLPKALPANASRPGTIRNGDLMLYGTDSLVVFYSTFDSSYSYTRLGRVDDPDLGPSAWPACGSHVFQVVIYPIDTGLCTVTIKAFGAQAGDLSSRTDRHHPASAGCTTCRSPSLLRRVSLGHSPGALRMGRQHAIPACRDTKSLAAWLPWAHVAGVQVGDLVGVGCIVDSCKHCEDCDEGLENYCDHMVGTPTAGPRTRPATHAI